MKIPAVRLSFRAGLVEIPTHGVASQRYDWPSYCCTLECKRIRTVSRRWWFFQNLRWSQVLTSVHNRISPPQTLFSIWQMILSSKWIWPSFRNEDLHLRSKAIRLSASCHSPWWMTSCRKPNKTSLSLRKQVPEISFWNDKCLSLRNDLWLSFREPSRFYRTKSDRNGSETRSESRVSRA